MKLIPLTQGKFAQVDNNDYEWLMEFTWHINKGGYAKTNMVINGIWKKISMHRMILNLTDSSILTDHINHNKLCNCRYNLRTCTHSGNMKNFPPKGRSKYLGVSFKRQTVQRKNRVAIYEYIVSMIYVNGKNKHLGLFKDEATAAYAYDLAAIRYHGEFANLNFPEKIKEYKLLIA